MIFRKKNMHLFTNAAAYLVEDDIQKKRENLRAARCCLSAHPKRKENKICIFYGIRFIAIRDMICMRQHQLALPSKMHVHKFHVSLFFMQIPL